MGQRLEKAIKPILKSLFALVLIAALAFGNADGALAARSGGRIGGGSFRAPTSRTYSAPRSSAPGGGYYGGGYGGGGFGFPFLIPLWGFGGGFTGLFGIFIFIALANFLVQTFRRASSDDGVDTEYTSNPSVCVTKLQVGLLAGARGLQTELNRIAEAADTNTSSGRAHILQETSLALLRHPEYWVYAGANNKQAALNSAEAEFNRLSLGERSKFTEETLSNVNNQLKAVAIKDALPSTGELDNPTTLINSGPGEYIIVTLLTATLGKFQLPAINNTEDLRQCLRQIGAMSSDKLLAIEVLWTPQAEGDTLTADDLLAEYADLKMV